MENDNDENNIMYMGIIKRQVWDMRGREGRGGERRGGRGRGRRWWASTQDRQTKHQQHTHTCIQGKNTSGHVTQSDP